MGQSSQSRVLSLIAACLMLASCSGESWETIEGRRLAIGDLDACKRHIENANVSRLEHDLERLAVDFQNARRHCSADRWRDVARLACRDYETYCDDLRPH